MQNFGSVILLPHFEAGGHIERGCAIIRFVRQALSLEIARNYRPRLGSKKQNKVR